MGSLFSKPKMPDTSAQEAAVKVQEARLKAQEDKQTADEAAARRKAAGSTRARTGRGAGGQSLLTGLETGLRDTLG